MSDDIVTRLRRHSHTEYPMGDGQVFRLKMPVLSEAADEIERLRTLARALYADARACPTNHDVSATNAWELYEEALDV